MSNNKILSAMFLLLMAVLAACAPQGAQSGTSEPTEVPSATVETPESSSAPDAVTAAATAQLASELGIPEADIEVVSVVATEFTDSCLGLGQANESCLQAITAGWLVMLNANGQVYEVHTDETGEQARVAADAGSAADPEAATTAAVAFLSSELGIPATDITLVSLEGAEFTNSCLGLGQANESCLQAITPGWLVMLDAAGQTYEVHTDESGEQVRIATDAGSAPDAVTAAATAQLASELGIPEADIEVVSAVAADFTDSCLGLGQANESCLQTITPGWLVMLDATGQTYEVHTDVTGEQVRMAAAPSE